MSSSACVANELVTANAKLLRWLRAADSKPALSGPQASALGVIIHADGIRMSDLAGLEEVSRPTITNTAAQLEREGLIDRQSDPTDGRVSWLRATERGRRIFAEGQSRRIAPLASGLAELTDDDRLVLLRSCRIINALLPGSAKADAIEYTTREGP